MRARTAQASLLAVLVSCVLAAGAGSGRATGQPRTLVSLTAPIRSFAQDGAYVGWMTGRCRAPYGQIRDQVVVLEVSSRRRHVLADVCAGKPYDVPGLALSGTRALYRWPVEEGNLTYYRFAAAGVERGKPVTLGVTGVIEVGSAAPYLASAGGEGGMLVRGIAQPEVENEACLDTGARCAYSSSGGMSRLEGTRLIPIPGVSAPSALDASGAYVAVAPAARRWDDDTTVFAGQPVPTAVGGTVEVREARTGTLRTSFAPAGRVVDLALAGDVAAVLVSGDGTVRIERRSAVSGRLLDAVHVPPAARDLDVAGNNVVYRVGRAVYVSASGRTALVARAAATPIGLSIAGRRIAWAENVGGKGRVQSVTLRRPA